MTDRAIKEERSLTAVNEPPSMLDSYVYLCIYTLAMLLTQRLSTYVRTYVRKYLRIGGTSLPFSRRCSRCLGARHLLGVSSYAMYILILCTAWLHGAMTKRKRLRLFTLDDALAKILSGSRLLNDLRT